VGNVVEQMPVQPIGYIFDLNSAYLFGGKRKIKKRVLDINVLPNRITDVVYNTHVTTRKHIPNDRVQTDT
jgi:hypothetical protein